MKITNKFNQPEEIVKFLSAEFYDYEEAKDSLTATTLIKPTRAIILTKRHEDKLEVDVNDLFYAMWGSAVHAALEKMDDPDAVVIKERRFFGTIGGKLISGKIDRMVISRGTGVLKDYKTCSPWKLIFEDLEDWIKQLSIYRLLIEGSVGVKVSDKAKVIAIMRDWREGEVAQFAKYKYPECNSRLVPIQLMPREETIAMVKEKLADLDVCASMSDEDLPFCTNEERWVKRGVAKRCKYCIPGKNGVCSQYNNDGGVVKE